MTGPVGRCSAHRPGWLPFAAEVYGGIFDPATNPGQHVWTAMADPATGAGIFAGLVRIDAVSGVALTSMLNNQTDWAPDYPPERVELLRRTMPAHQLTSVRPVDLLEHDPARVWVLTYYELRLLLTSPPPASSAWRAKRVVLTAEDASVGVTAELDEQGDLALVRIQSPVSRTVHWVVEFERERD